MDEKLEDAQKLLNECPNDFDSTPSWCYIKYLLRTIIAVLQLKNCSIDFLSKGYVVNKTIDGKLYMFAGVTLLEATTRCLMVNNSQQPIDYENYKGYTEI